MKKWKFEEVEIGPSRLYMHGRVLRKKKKVRKKRHIGTTKPRFEKKVVVIKSGLFSGLEVPKFSSADVVRWCICRCTL